MALRRVGILPNFALRGLHTIAARSASRVGSARAWLADTDLEGERLQLAHARRVVVKCGTSVVSNDDGTLALSRIGAMVEQIREMKEEGRDIMLVSSGAVGLGRLRLGLTKDTVKDPKNVIDRQACAAVGQGILMSTYDMLFQRMGLVCAQVLVTQSDLVTAERYGHLTDTLDRLLALGTIPIINENDVVTGCSELDTHRVFSDNDKLSALLAASVDADGLALLTDVEAIFTKPPHLPDAERIAVMKADMKVEEGDKSSMGRGGILSKIAAARISAHGGVNTCVVSGYDVQNIKRVFSGVDIGTLFPAESRPNKRHRWLSFCANPEGQMVLSDAARDAVFSDSSQGILSSDVKSVKGHWSCDTGSRVVSIVNEAGEEYARGLAKIGSQELIDIMDGDDAKPLVRNADIALLQGLCQINGNEKSGVSIHAP